MHVACMHSFMHVCTCMYVYTHVRVYVCLFVCLYVCMYMYVPIYVCRYAYSIGFQYWHVHQFHHTSTNINLINIYCIYCHILRKYHVVHHISQHHVSCFMYITHTSHTIYSDLQANMFSINHTWFITCHISWCHVSEKSVPDTMFSVGYQTIQIASHISRNIHQISTYGLNIKLNKSNQICVYGPTRPALICLDIQKNTCPCWKLSIWSPPICVCPSTHPWTFWTCYAMLWFYSMHFNACLMIVSSIPSDGTIKQDDIALCDYS